MKIFEQIDWGQAESDQKTIDQGKQLIVKKQLTPTNTTPKKDDTKKDSEPKKDKGKSIERSEKLTPQATYQWKLISNSIKFIEAINLITIKKLEILTKFNIKLGDKYNIINIAYLFHDSLKSLSLSL